MGYVLKKCVELDLEELIKWYCKVIENDFDNEKFYYKVLEVKLEDYIFYL